MTAASMREMAGRSGEDKQVKASTSFLKTSTSFLKKKKQKTFGRFGCGPSGYSERRLVKVFWFFFSKKNAFLHAPSALMELGISLAEKTICARFAFGCK
jgi:hypothetical protein